MIIIITPGLPLFFSALLADRRENNNISFWESNLDDDDDDADDFLLPSYREPGKLQYSK